MTFAAGLATVPACRSIGAGGILLLQFRDHRMAEMQERRCFREISGCDEDRFRYLNLLECPAVTESDLEGVTALVLGGAGSHSVTDEHPFTAPLTELIRSQVDAGLPIFGSCFGHQFLAVALGGRVETDLERAELGTFDIELTPAGRRDPLFAGLPGRFPVQLGHNDRVVELPPGAVELAASDRCPVQAFRYRDAPVWGCQFHVELSPERMIERASIYRDGYLPDGDLEALAGSLRASPEAASLFGRFLALATGADPTGFDAEYL